MSDTIPPEWMEPIAKEFRKLVESHMPRAPETLLRWAARQMRDLGVQNDWESRRKEHFRTIPSDQLLQKPERPGPDWVLERTLDRIKDESGDGPVVEREGWIPKELAETNKPDVSGPLPLSKKHTLTLEEKFVILIAIHDIFYDRGSPIDPFRDTWTWDGNERRIIEQEYPDVWNQAPYPHQWAETPEWFKSLYEDEKAQAAFKLSWVRAVMRVNYNDLLKQVPLIQQCDKLILEACLAAVTNSLTGAAVALKDPIPVVEVVRVVGRKAGRPDKLAEKMQRRNYPTKKIARKWHCQRADAIAMFPHHQPRIKDI